MRCNFVPAVSVKKMQIVPCISTKTTMALEQNISPILSGIRLIPQTIRYEVYSKLSDFVLGGTQFSIMKDRTINTEVCLLIASPKNTMRNFEFNGLRLDGVNSCLKVSHRKITKLKLYCRV